MTQASAITNRNFLSPTGFKFALKRSPKVAFFCNQANIPELTLGIAKQPSYLKDIDIPGDKLEFGDLTLRFLVDEDLGNYIEIQNWLRGLGYPEEIKQYRDLNAEAPVFGKYTNDQQNIYSDGTLQVLSSNLIPNFQVVFKDLFPYSLSTINFNATETDVEYFTAEVSFKYTIYNLTDLNNKAL